jgi:hypothetical protein
MTSFCSVGAKLTSDEHESKATHHAQWDATIALMV